jgi:hypothetical protein
MRPIVPERLVSHTRIFPETHKTITKLLIALVSSRSGVLISGNFRNSGNGSRRARRRATLPVKQTEIKRRRLPQDGRGRRRGTWLEVHAGEYTPGRLQAPIPVVTSLLKST